MALAKKKPVERTPADLLDEVHALRARLEEFITERCMELKAGRDGQGLPIQVLRNGLTGHETCLCRVVAKILGDVGA